MKSLPVILFLTVLVQSTCAAKLKIGAHAIDITPKLNVLLDGTISKPGPAKAVHDRLHARCLAFDDGRTRVAIAIIDNTMIAREILDDARSQIHKAIGIPKTHILLAGTHSHSTPRAVNIGQGQANERYHLQLARLISQGVQNAFTNLQPAELGWNSFEEPRFVHNRRWFVDKRLTPPNPFGEKTDQVWMNPPRGSLIRPAGPVDTEVYVVSARTEKGDPLFLLGNYGLHYVGGIPRGQISADYFGVFSERVKDLIARDNKSPGFVGLMSNGTSGDVNAINFRGERQRFPAYHRMQHIGSSLATNAAKLYRSLKFSNQHTIKVASQELTLGVRKPNQKRVAWAKETLANAKPSKSKPRNVIYATEAMALNQYPPNVKIMLQAIRIGDLVIAAIPNEVFAETGLAIKAGSPFPATFTIELANGYSGYLPTPQQHKWGGYETWPARSSFLETQAEAKIRKSILELIKSLK